MKSQDNIKMLSPLAMLMLSTMLLALPAQAADTGLLSPVSYATGTTGNASTDPGQALVDDVATGNTNDSLCAEFRTDNPPSHVADSQTYYDFSLNVPAGATIDGIEVVVSGYRTGGPSATNFQFAVRLSGAAGTAGSWTAAKSTPELLRNADAEYTLGGAADQWGGSWTADSFSNANFRLEITAAGQSNTGEHWKLDSVRVKVYYTLACVWIPETAWADGTRYEDPGNWATYTTYAENNTVTLYAGQNMDAGTVHFSAPVSGVVTITITLNAGWRFEAVAENVKIQDYATAPSGNPNPGGFVWKGDAAGSPFSIGVPANNFYGVHVDVERQVCQ